MRRPYSAEMHFPAWFIYLIAVVWFAGMAFIAFCVCEIGSGLWHRWHPAPPPVTSGTRPPRR